MKKYLFLLFVALGVTFVSCEKDLLKTDQVTTDEVMEFEGFTITGNAIQFHGDYQVPVLKAAGEQDRDTEDQVSGSIPSFVDPQPFDTRTNSSYSSGVSYGSGGSIYMDDPISGEITTMYLCAIDTETPGYTQDSYTLKTKHDTVGGPNDLAKIGVFNIDENLAIMVGDNIDPSSTSTWNVHDIDYYNELATLISETAGWDWSDDYAIMVMSVNTSVYVDNLNYKTTCTQTATPTISGSSSITVSYLPWITGGWYVSTTYDDYQWSSTSSGVSIISGGTTKNSCVWQFASTGTKTLKLSVKNDEDCYWSVKGTKVVTVSY